MGEITEDTFFQLIFLTLEDFWHFGLNVTQVWS